MRSAVFRELFDASPNPYLVLDRELRIVAANRAYLATTSSTAEALIGRYLFDAFPNEPDDPNNEPRRLLEASLRKVLRTGEPDTLAYIPYRVPTEPGGPPVLRVWSATHTPLRDPGGEVAYVLQQTQDVTDLRRDPAANKVLSNVARVEQAARGLDEQLRGLRAMLEQAPGFMAFLAGPQHVFQLANPAYDQLVGGRKVLGLPIREALPDIADQGYYELLDRVFTSGEPFVGRAMRVDFASSGDREPRHVYVDFVYQPILGEDGRAIGILVQGHDVTEQQRSALRQQFLTRATEQLAAAHDDLEPALVAVAQAAVETVADFAVIDLYDGETSRRVASVAADPADAELARQFAAFPSPPRLPSTHLLHTSQEVPVVRQVTPEQLAASARGPAHSDVLARLAFRTMLTLPLWHRGQLFGLLVLMTSHSGRAFDDHDLDAMRELGRVMSTALDNARLSSEREALLASEHAARERAEAASRAKDDFLAMLGHELRNPLAPILTAVQLMQMRGSPEAKRELEIIERQTQHLVRLVDDLLDVSRIVHNKIELRVAEVELGVVAAKALEIAGPQIRARDHHLEVEVAPGLRLRGDEARLAQVIANLLTNAARYTPRGGQIALRADRDGDEIVVRVRDNGVGITPEMLPTIFDMFVQAPQAADRAAGGLGIGLTLVRRLVEMHGGTVQAFSAGVGQGSELVVRLPASTPSPRATPAHGRKVTQAERTRRVLVVDDNVDAAELLGELLARRGHTTAVSHDGEDALAAILADPPDVAVIDLGLPGIDGYALATRVREQLGPRAPRMIAVTGYGGADDRERGRQAGFAHHLTKPVDIATLVGLIDPVQPT